MHLVCYKSPEPDSPIQVHPITEIGAASMKAPRPTLIKQNTRNTIIGSIGSENNEEDMSQLKSKRRFTELPNLEKKDTFFNKFNTIHK